jgi:hypothetical protein
MSMSYDDLRAAFFAAMSSEITAEERAAASIAFMDRLAEAPPDTPDGIGYTVLLLGDSRKLPRDAAELAYGWLIGAIGDVWQRKPDLILKSGIPKRLMDMITSGSLPPTTLELCAQTLQTIASTESLAVLKSIPLAARSKVVRPEVEARLANL